MKRAFPRTLFVLAGCLLVIGFLRLDAVRAGSGVVVPEGWSSKSPRDEIRPAFSYLRQGGPQCQGSFVIEADKREGLYGWWEKTFAVDGGQHYKFSALRQLTEVDLPRRTAVVRIIWHDKDGKRAMQSRQWYFSPSAACSDCRWRSRAGPRSTCFRRIGFTWRSPPTGWTC